MKNVLSQPHLKCKNSHFTEKKILICLHDLE